MHGFNLLLLTRLHFPVLPAHRFYIPPHVHIYRHPRFFWFHGCQKICKNHFYNRFVEDFYVAECVDVKLERFQFKAPAIRHIMNFNAPKIRKIGKWTNTCELRRRNRNPLLASGSFFIRKSHKRRGFFEPRAQFHKINLLIILPFAIEFLRSFHKVRPSAAFFA